MGTLALVVPALTDRAPEIASEPPVAVPATIILSGFVAGICALVVGVLLLAPARPVQRREYVAMDTAVY